MEVALRDGWENVPADRMPEGPGGAGQLLTVLIHVEPWMTACPGCGARRIRAAPDSHLHVPLMAFTYVTYFAGSLIILLQVDWAGYYCNWCIKARVRDFVRDHRVLGHKP